MLSKSTFLISFLLILFAEISNSQPMSTRSRWISDKNTNRRIKLHCVNWIAHQETMVPEGLDKKPLEKIISNFANLGFNCVRLTWALQMYTRPEYSDLTLSRVFDKHDLSAAKAGILKHNPSLVDLKVGDVHERVVNAIGNENLMVVYDNPVSRPAKCCSDDDENGFFKNSDFRPEEWLKGMKIVATRYKNNPTVVAMSMRNNTYHPREKTSEGVNYTAQGAKVIHDANPNVVVFISELHNDTHYSYKNPVDLQKFNQLLQTFSDAAPSRNETTYFTMYHHMTGTCAMANIEMKLVSQVNCSKKSGWNHTGDGTPITLRGDALCLTVAGEGRVVTLSKHCTGTKSLWSLMSDLKQQIGVKDPKGDLCLEWGLFGNATVLVSNKCNLKGDKRQNQWFQLLPTKF